MGDPYRQNTAYDYPTTTTASHAPYNPSQYAPPAGDQYSGALTTRHGSTSSNYYPSQSNTQLTQSSYRPSDSDYLDPHRPRSGHRHGHKSRDHSRHGRDVDRDEDGHRGHGRDKSRSRSRGAEWGATLAGAAAGGLLGHKAGHGEKLGTFGGIIAGAVGAHELERGYEKRREKKRLEDPYADERPSNHRRRSSGGLLDGVKEKVEGLLNPDSGKDKRRSKSHVSSSRRDRGYDDYSDEDYDDRYDKRSSGGGRSRRDDYY